MGIVGAEQFVESGVDAVGPLLDDLAGGTVGGASDEGIGLVDDRELEGFNSCERISVSAGDGPVSGLLASASSGQLSNRSLLQVEISEGDHRQREGA